MKKIHENETSLRARVDAVFSKLPELRKHFDWTEIQKMSFRDVTADILKELASGHYLNPLACDNSREFLKSRTIFLSETGAFIGQVGVKEIPEQKNMPRKFLWMKWEETQSAYKKLCDESIQNALNRLNKENTVHFIVSLVFEVHGQTTRPHLIISKASDRSSVKEKLDAELEDAKSFVTDQIGEISPEP